MDLTFQVPMEYCSLQYQILLPSPVTSTTGCSFCFGSVPLFFLELFLHSSPVAYWVPTNIGSSSFSAPIFLLFHTVHQVLKARILKWFAITFSSGPTCQFSFQSQRKTMPKDAQTTAELHSSHTLAE